MRQVIALLVMGTLLSFAHADIVTHHLYTPTSLPSEQGWTFASSGLDEADVFTLGDGVLIMDTMGSGYSGLPFVYYTYSVDADEAFSATFRVRARVIASEALPHAYPPGFHFTGWVPSWGYRYLFGLDEQDLSLRNLTILDLDTSQWHDYVLVTEGYHPDGEATLLVDGVEVAFDESMEDGAINNLFAFGDVGFSANAHVEIAEIEITTFTDTPVAVQATTLSAIKALFAN
ncbi:hypothetical protein GF314_11955 [bacterium]|nr:hypothetical protein [bacterium]